MSRQAGCEVEIRSRCPARVRSRLAASVLALIVTLAGCRDRTALHDTDGGPDADADGGPSLDTRRPDAEDVPYCPLDRPMTARILGDTPLHHFEGYHGWFGVMGGECGGTILAVFADPQDFIDSLPDPYPPHGPEDVLLMWTGLVSEGWAEVRATHRLDGQEVESQGTIHFPSYPDFNRYDPSGDPRLTGTVSVIGSGWELQGDFNAPYCEHLHVLCP